MPKKLTEKENVVIDDLSSNFSADKNNKNKNLETEQTSVDSNVIDAKNSDILSNDDVKNEVEALIQDENSKLEEKSDFNASEEYAKEKLEEAFKVQSPKKRRKSIIVSLILLLVNLVFMAIIINNLIKNVGDQDFSKIILKQGSKLWWLAVAFIFYGLYMFSQVIMYHALIKDLTGKSRWSLSYDVSVVGKYYDNVTPFAVGGQPMQIVRLAKNGVSPGVSTGIPVIKMIINSIMNMVLAVIFFVIGLPKIPTTGGLNDFLLVLLEILGIIGLIITVLVVLFLILISTGSLFTRTIVSWVIKLGHKLKIVKNYRMTLRKVLGQVAEYKNSFSYLLRHKKLLLKMALYSILECLSYASFPYLVVMAFAGDMGMSPLLFMFICYVKYYICLMASSFIPLPGGTGLMEISFIFLFGIVVNESIVFALLIWRFFSYYLIIIHGFVHEMIKIFKNISRNKQKEEIP